MTNCCTFVSDDNTELDRILECLCHVPQYFSPQSFLRINLFLLYVPVADPGFPVGGHGPIRGHVDPRCGHFLAKMCAKMKEFGLIGGRAPGTHPRSANVYYIKLLASLKQASRGNKSSMRCFNQKSATTFSFEIIYTKYISY